MCVGSESKPFSVYEISRLIRELLETGFQQVSVEGDVTNVKVSGLGHTYFSLTGPAPDGGVVRIECVVWRSSNVLTGLRLQDGMKIVATGKVSAWAGSSRYQLVVARIVDIGRGDLLARLEELKKRLKAEGLFDEARKRPLPFLPRRIGVVTSLRGAAVRDIIRTVFARFPARILIVDSLVQGEGAAAKIADGIRMLNCIEDVDVIIIGRGGGSMEDLWAFNEEILVRAVAASAKPIISAVGHEIDHVLTDDAADFRAPTPTYAGREVVPSITELRVNLVSFRERLFSAFSNKLRFASQRLDEVEARLSNAAMRLFSDYRHRLEALATRLEACRPARRLAEERRVLYQLEFRLRSSGLRLLERPRASLEKLATRLQPLSPFAPLNRGYALARDKNGQIIKAYDQIDEGECIDVLLGRGALSCEVLSKRAER